MREEAFEYRLVTRHGSRVLHLMDAWVPMTSHFDVSEKELCTLTKFLQCPKASFLLRLPFLRLHALTNDFAIACGMNERGDLKESEGETRNFDRTCPYWGIRDTCIFLV